MKRIGHRPWQLGLLCLALAASAAGAQEDEDGWAAPNEERSSYDTLFERSDLGNVVQAATMAYAAGDRQLKRAHKLEEKLAGLEGKKQTKAEANIAEAYESAASSFQEAIQLDPKMIEAYVGLGEAFRGSGKFAESMQVSSQGLKLEPDNDELFAGWGESILGLNMLGDATQLYAQLAETDPQRAEILMGLLKQWLTDRQADHAGVSDEAIARLEEWIEAQEGAG